MIVLMERRKGDGYEESRNYFETNFVYLSTGKERTKSILGH